MRAKALLELGRMDYLTGGEKAIEMLAQSLSLSRGLADTRGAAAALFDLGIDALMRGDLARATPFLVEAGTLAEDAGDVQTIAMARLHLGLIALDQAGPEDAEPVLEEALALFRRRDDAYGDDDAAGSRLGSRRSPGRWRDGSGTLRGKPRPVAGARDQGGAGRYAGRGGSARRADASRSGQPGSSRRQRRLGRPLATFSPSPNARGMSERKRTCAQPWASERSLWSGRPGLRRHRLRPPPRLRPSGGGAAR